MKCLFMGTPDIAVPPLQALIDSSHEVVGVVSQPDRPVGRGMKVHSPPIIALAKKHKIKTFQPDSLKDPKLLESWKELGADVIVVVAYGKFLPQSLLDLPPKSCINVHFSLLPKYRGAAPVNWAIINNDEETGVTTMFMTLKMDAGPILKQRKAKILSEDTTDILGKRLANIGAELLMETIEDLDAGKLKPTEQNEAEVTLAPQLKKENGLIDWNKKAELIVKHIYGVTPWPGAFAYLESQASGVDKVRLKVYSPYALNRKTDDSPGTIVNLTPDGMEVAGHYDVVVITEVQPEGKRRMTAVDFVNGHKIQVGMRFTQ